RYTQRYDYDLSGNLTRVRHAGATRGWTTGFGTSPNSNRSLPLVDPGGVQPTNREAGFDPAGNGSWLPYLRSLGWSYRGCLDHAVVIDRSAEGGVDDAEYYLF